MEKVKELEHTNYDLDIANARIQQEIDDLKGQVIKYKDRLNESMKYKDIVQNLIDKNFEWIRREYNSILMLLLSIQHYLPNDEINKRIELFNINKTKLYSYNFNCDIDNKLS